MHLVEDAALRADEALLEFCCLMNMQNWKDVPRDMQSMHVFESMLKSPWNSADATHARIPPLVLQIGPKEDRDDLERVLLAVRHSGYNLQFASKRARANAAIVAWAAATEEVRRVSKHDATLLAAWEHWFLNRPVPKGLFGVSSNRPMLEAFKRSLQDAAGNISVDLWKAYNAELFEKAVRIHSPNSSDCGKGLETMCCPSRVCSRAPTFFRVPRRVREMLWPEYADGAALTQHMHFFEAPQERVQDERLWWIHGENRPIFASCV